jgi:hypothetical protein
MTQSQPLSALSHTVDNGVDDGARPPLSTTPPIRGVVDDGGGVCTLGTSMERRQCSLKSSKADSRLVGGGSEALAAHLVESKEARCHRLLGGSRKQAPGAWKDYTFTAEAARRADAAARNETSALEAARPPAKGRPEGSLVSQA